MLDEMLRGDADRLVADAANDAAAATEVEAGIAAGEGDESCHAVRITRFHQHAVPAGSRRLPASSAGLLRASQRVAAGTRDRLQRGRAVWVTPDLFGASEIHGHWGSLAYCVHLRFLCVLCVSAVYLTHPGPFCAADGADRTRGSIASPRHRWRSEVRILFEEDVRVETLSTSGRDGGGVVVGGRRGHTSP